MDADGLARMAAARRAAGVPLSDADIEELRLRPDPPMTCCAADVETYRLRNIDE